MLFKEMVFVVRIRWDIIDTILRYLMLNQAVRVLTFGI